MSKTVCKVGGLATEFLPKSSARSYLLPVDEYLNFVEDRSCTDWGECCHAAKARSVVETIVPSLPGRRQLRPSVQATVESNKDVFKTKQ